MFSVNSSLSTSSTSKLPVCPRAAMMFEEGRYLYRTQVAFRAIKKKKKRIMGRKTLHPDERKTKTKQTSLAAVLKSLQTMHRCGKLTNVKTLHTEKKENISSFTNQEKVANFFGPLKYCLLLLSFWSIIYIIIYCYQPTSLTKKTFQIQTIYKKKKKNFNKWFVLSRQLVNWELSSGCSHAADPKPQKLFKN